MQIPAVESVKTLPVEKFMSALDFLRSEREKYIYLGASARELWLSIEEWKSKNEEEKQLCYMDFAEHYADYLCNYEKTH